jgi:hypothetical protein
MLAAVAQQTGANENFARQNLLTLLLLINFPPTNKKKNSEKSYLPFAAAPTCQLKRRHFPHLLLLAPRSQYLLVGSIA